MMEEFIGKLLEESWIEVKIDDDDKAEDVIEEKDAKDVSEEKDAKDVSEEKDAKDVSEEKDAKDVSEEKDARDVSEEKDAKDVSEDKATGRTKRASILNVYRCSYNYYSHWTRSQPEGSQADDRIKSTTLFQYKNYREWNKPFSLSSYLDAEYESEVGNMAVAGMGFCLN
jgi:hypothetical protein